MDWSQFSVHVTWALFGVAALSLFATGDVLARRLRTAPDRIPGQQGMMPLLEAATAARACADRERLAILATARRTRASRDLQEWFAQNMATIVPTYRMTEAGAFEKLQLPIGVGTNTQSLYIRKQDLQTYMHWAHTVQ